MSAIVISYACLMLYRPPVPESTQAAIRAIGANPTGWV